MALIIYWYDSICFAIVGVSFLASSWVLWRNEFANTRGDRNKSYESLRMPAPDSDGYVEAMPRNHVGSFQLWTSCRRGFHPGWLMATRLVSFLVMAGLLFNNITDWGFTVLMYYSGWTFALVTVYFAIGTAISAYGCWVPKKQTLVEDEETGTRFSTTSRRTEAKGSIELQSHFAEEALSEETETTNSITYRRTRARFWGYLMQIVYQTCAGAVTFADLSFWCVIVPFGSKEQIGLNMVMGYMHTLNAAFLLLDTALNSMPFPWFRIAYFVIWGCIYCIFQWVIHACGFTWWSYPFLELDLPWAPYWYLVLVVLHVPFYGIYALIVGAKNSLFSKWFPKAFLRSY